MIDSELEIWDIYGNQGWPARYLWDADHNLHSMHYGEGAYVETELEIQALLGVARDPVAPVRPEDAEDALIAAQTEDQPGAYSGPYEAGGVWLVVEGAGVVRSGEHELARHRAGLLRADRAPAPHGGRAGARGRRGRDRPRHLLHALARGLRISWPRSPSRRTSRGGPSSSTITAVPGQYGEPFGCGLRKCGW